MSIFNRARKYDLRKCNLIVGGIPIDGFGNGGAITFEPNADRYERRAGADGQQVFHAVNDDSWTVNIVLSPRSRAVNLMYNLFVVQEALPTGFVPTPFSFTDLLSGDTWNDAYAVFMRWPSQARSQTFDDVEYQLVLPGPKFAMGIGNII